MTWPTVWDVLAIGSFYEQHAWAIDSIIFLVLFTGAAQVSLGSTYKGRGGRAMVAAVGAALTIGAATLAHRTGFTLASLGPLAWLILLGLLGFMLFGLTRSIGLSRLPAACIAVLVMFTTAAGLGQALTPWLVDAGLMLPLQLLVLFAILALVWWVASHFNHLPKLGRPSPFGRHSSSSAWSSFTGASHDHAGKSSSSPTDDDTRAIIDLDASIGKLLHTLVHLIKRDGLTRRSLHLLKEIKRRERMVAKLYRHVLRTLARMQWKADADRHHLPQQLKVLLAAAKDNLSDFDRNLELAIIAHEQHNQPLLMGSLERLLALEERALQHAEQLRRVLERMREQRPTPDQQHRL